LKYINYLIKPASSLCNLECKYCFYEDEAQSRNCKNMGLMKENTVDSLLNKAFAEIERDGMVSFAFQGGEPTLAGLDYFRNFVLKAKSGCPKNVKISFSIQTNGILINEEWAKFFKDENFLVGISIDGYKDLHNINRQYHTGEGTWNKVIKSLLLLQKYNVDVNGLCVVTQKCARSPEKVYNCMKKLGLRFVQFIACLDPKDGARGEMPYSLTPEIYGNFLCRIFDLWYEDWLKGDYVSIRLFEDYVHILLGDSSSTCATCGKCGTYFVIEGDGSVFPCDFYATDEWCMGNVGVNSLTEMLNLNFFSDFMAIGREKPTECNTCEWQNICNGGCKNDWFISDGKNHNYFCASIQNFLGYAMPRLIQIARAEYAAGNR